MTNQWTREWGAAYVEAARAWIGTPFLHASRARGRGVDCFGLCVCAALDMGLPVTDDHKYAKGDQLRRLIAWYDQYAVRIQGLADAGPGDNLIARYKGMPHHCAVYDGVAGVIHAWPSVGQVINAPLPVGMEDSLYAIYRFRVEERPPCL